MPRSTLCPSASDTLEACEHCRRYYDKCPWCGETRPPDPHPKPKTPEPENPTAKPTASRAEAHAIARIKLSTGGKGPL